MAKKLNSTQTFVSKVERGERRLDVIDLLELLAIYGVAAPDFIRDFQAALGSSR